MYVDKQSGRQELELKVLGILWSEPGKRVSTWSPSGLVGDPMKRCHSPWVVGDGRAEVRTAHSVCPQEDCGGSRSQLSPPSKEEEGVRQGTCLSRDTGYNSRGSDGEQTQSGSTVKQHLVEQWLWRPPTPELYSMSQWITEKRGCRRQCPG